MIEEFFIDGCWDGIEPREWRGIKTCTIGDWAIKLVGNGLEWFGTILRPRFLH